MKYEDVQPNMKAKVIDPVCAHYGMHCLVTGTASVGDQQYIRTEIHGAFGFVLYKIEQLKFEKTLDQEFDDLIAELPPAFQSFVRNQAYDRGHSAGMDEVVSIARGLVFDLRQCIANYKP